MTAPATTLADAAEAPAGRLEDAGYPPAALAWFGLAVLVLASTLAAVDRQILILVMEPLKRQLHLSDAQVGAFNGVALSLVAALATYPLGWLCDRIDRRVLLATCVVIWSVFTAACGLSQSFGQLFGFGIGTAVGEAVLGPIIYAFIPDLFPRRRWILVNYVFYISGVLAGAAGLAASGGILAGVGLLAPILPARMVGAESWRGALVVAATLGAPLAAMILLIRARRASAETGTDKAAAPGDLVGYFRRHARTAAGIFLGFGLVATAQGTFGPWIPIALIRVYHQSPAHIGVALGGVSAAASLLGVLGSALLVRWLTRSLGPRAPARAAQIGGACALLVCFAYPFTHSAAQVYAAMLLQHAFTTSTLSLSPTLLQRMAPAAIRGRVIAAGGLIYIGMLSVSPLLVGLVSDRLGKAPNMVLLAVTLIAAPAYLLGILFIRFAESGFLSTLDAVEQEDLALERA